MGGWSLLPSQFPAVVPGEIHKIGRKAGPQGFLAVHRPAPQCGRNPPQQPLPPVLPPCATGRLCIIFLAWGVSPATGFTQPRDLSRVDPGVPPGEGPTHPDCHANTHSSDSPGGLKAPSGSGWPNFVPPAISFVSQDKQVLRFRTPTTASN